MNEIYYKEFESNVTTKYKDHYTLSEKYFDDNDELFGLNIHPSFFKNSDLEYHPNSLKWEEETTYTTKEKFDENFTNLLCRIFCNRVKIIVTKNDEKVSIKLFTYTKIREVNKPYYRMSTECCYITYSGKRNMFYSGKIINYHKKRKFQKSVKVVGFSNNFVNDLISSINLTIHHVLSKKPSEKVNSNHGYDAMTEFVKSIPNINYDENHTLFNNLYKFYLESREVKIPNNWYIFSGNYPQPTKKNITKNKFKLIESIMDVNKLKGDKVKKILHLVDNFNNNSLQTAYNLFGTDFIHSQPDEVVKKIIESKVFEYQSFNNFEFISKKERNNAFEIFKLVIDDEINTNTFSDHYSMIRTIRRYDTVRWNANTYLSFLEEHLNLTEKIQFYTQGIFTRIYSNGFTKYIEQPFNCDGVQYYPKILTTSNEYNTESFIQSNCVKGYINKCSSIIISLRRYDDENKERATIEIRVSKGDKINLKRIQTLGRFNKALDLTWENVLGMLDSRLKQSISLNLFDLPKIECKIGFKTFTSDSHFVNYRSSELAYHIRGYGDKDEEILNWVEKSVTNITGYDTNNIIPQLAVDQIIEEDF